MLTQSIESLIHEIRSKRVILDTDPGRVYSVSALGFDEAVKRNLERFTTISASNSRPIKLPL